MYFALSPMVTCLLSAPSGGQRAWAVPCRVEGSHADHVGGVACQVLQLHAQLRQEESAESLSLILQLKLPIINLARQITQINYFRILQSDGLAAVLKHFRPSLIKSVYQAKDQLVTWLLFYTNRIE